MKSWPARWKGRGVSSRCRGPWRGREPEQGRWAACLSALAGCTWGWVSSPGGWFLSCFWTLRWFPAPSWRKWLWLSAKQKIFPHVLIYLLWANVPWRPRINKMLNNFTQNADAVLTLLNLFSHHPADWHKTLCDVAAGFNYSFFGCLPETKTKKITLIKYIMYCCIRTCIRTLLFWRARLKQCIFNNNDFVIIHNAEARKIVRQNWTIQNQLYTS